MKKLLLIFVFSILILSSVSAYIKFPVSLTNEVSIKDNSNVDLIKVQLISNTYQCGGECEAVLKINVLSNNLISPLTKIKINKKISNSWVTSSIKSMDYYLWNGSNTPGENGTWIIKTLSNINSNLATSGIYYVKIVGNKKPLENLDWIPNFFNSVDITEWAIWGPAQVYDEINDSSINASLWEQNIIGNSGTECGNSWTEDTSIMTVKSCTGGTDSYWYQQEVNMSNMPELNKINNISTHISLISSFNAAGGSLDCGRARLYVFGNLIWTVEYCRLPGSSIKDSVWDIVRNESSGPNDFDIIIDSAYDSTITASNNEIKVETYANKNSAPGATGQAKIYYVYYSLYTSTTNIDSLSPIDNYSTFNKNIDFITNYSHSGPGLKNITLWLDGLSNETKSIFITDTSTNFSKTLNQGVHNWSVVICDDGMGLLLECKQSETRTFTISDVAYQSFNYSSTTLETTNEEFLTNISYDSSNWLSISGGVYYNNTFYSGTFSGSGDSLLFSTNVTIPLVSTSTIVPFLWSISLTNSSGIFSYNSSSFNQTINPLESIVVTTSTCGAGLFEAINYTFADETNLTLTNADVSYNFKYGTGNLTSKETSGSFNNINVLRICINSSISNYKLGYGEIDYTAIGKAERRYYMFEGHSLSNSTTEFFELYGLNLADSTSFIFEAKDPLLNAYVDNYISLLRWYPSLNLYKVVEMASLDGNGKSVMKVKVEDVDYRVGLYQKDGTLIKLAESVRMACLINPCTYTLTVKTSGADFFNIFDVTYNLDFDSSNNWFIFTWSDSGQNTKTMRLEVYKDAGFQQILICNSTASGYTGVLTCGIGNYTGSFYAKAYRTASPETPIANFYHSIRNGVKSGFGLFISFFIALATGLIGIFSPIGAIALLVVGLVVSLAFGAINYSIFIGIATLGGIVIHFLRKA